MRLLREPLLHFMLLGAGLFALFNWVGDRSEVAPREILVTAAKAHNLAAAFARTWQRPPTAKELDALVQDFIREEVLYREAVALGLERDDTIIRRRLRQKMEFIADDVAAQRQPTDEQLRAYLQEHAADYRLEDRFTFRHVYLDPERHRDDLDRQTQRLLAELQASASPINVGQFGDPFLLPHEFRDMPAREVDATLGEQFAAVLRRLPVGQWHGPIASGFGVHLVLVDERTAGRDPDLTEVRDTVLRDWERAQRTEANERFFQTLLAGYSVRIEPRGSGADAGLTQGQ